MKIQSNIAIFIKHSVFVVMFLGIVLQSTSQSLSDIFDFDIENTLSDNEEENEEEERGKKELMDEKITISPISISFNNSNKEPLKSLFINQFSVSDFILEIKIPPPKLA